MNAAALNLFLSKQTNLEFKFLELIPVVGDDLPTLRGHGAAAIGADGKFVVYIQIDSECKTKPSLGTVYELRAPQFGSELSDRECYNFYGTDIDGVLWALTQTEFETRVLKSTTQATYEANEIEIRCKSHHEQNWARLIGQRLNITLEIGLDVAITFGSLKDFIVIIVTSSRQIPRSLEDRLLAGLSFIMDESLDATSIKRKDSTSLTTTLSGTAGLESDSDPIIIFEVGQTDYLDIIKNILTKYIDFENRLNHMHEKQYHPLEYLLRIQRQPKLAVLDLKILTTCVVAEGMINFFSENVGEESPAEETSTTVEFGEIHQAKAKVLDFIEGMECSVNVRKRISGALTRVGEPSAKDGFYKLISNGKIGEENFKKWKDLRDSYAHLRQKTLANRENVLQRYKEYNMVIELIRQIVFSCINYSGPYTTYVDGCRRCHYPLTVERI